MSQPAGGLYLMITDLDEWIMIMGGGAITRYIVAGQGHACKAW